MAKQKKKSVAPPKDFEKKKTKVGRLNPGAANATSTKFTAKDLNLRDQAIPEEEDIQARRSDVLARITVRCSQLDHYSASFRRDALFGLLKDVKLLPDLGDHVISIAGKLAKCVIDEDPQVRQTNIAIWKWLFERQSTDSVISCILSIIVPFLKMGLTHLKKEICADAAKLMSTLVLIRPKCFKPFVPELLPHLTRHFHAKSFECPKKNAVDLVELFCESCSLILKSESDDESMRQTLEYTWKPIQEKSLIIQPRIISVKQNGISKDQLKSSVLSNVFKAAAPVWCQVGYLLSSPSFACQDDEEKEQFDRCFKVLKTCYSLCTKFDLDFHEHLPKLSSTSNLFVSLLKKLESH